MIVFAEHVPLVAVSVIFALAFVWPATSPTVRVVFWPGLVTLLPPMPLAWLTDHTTPLVVPFIVVVPVLSHSAVGGLVMLF